MTEAPDTREIDSCDGSCLGHCDIHMTDLDLDAIQARVDAAAPGPWWWGGNVDHHGDVGLRGRKSGSGVIDILRNLTEDIDKEEAGREWDTTDASDFIDRESYIEWRTENPKSYLAFLSEDELFVEHGRDLAVFEVARNQGLPDDTPRSHPKVYRGDVIGVRNANATFIAHARTDIPALIAEVKALRGKVATVGALHSKTQRPQIAGCTCGAIICPTLAALQSSAPTAGESE